MMQDIQNEMVTLHTKLPMVIWKEIRKIALDKNMTVAQILTEVLTEYLEQYYK